MGSSDGKYLMSAGSSTVGLGAAGASSAAAAVAWACPGSDVWQPAAPRPRMQAATSGSAPHGAKRLARAAPLAVEFEGSSIRHNPERETHHRRQARACGLPQD